MTESPQHDDKICVLGLGFIGLTVAGTLADVGYEVHGVDVSPDVVASLKNKKCYFFEPGLQELIDRHGNERLTFHEEIPDKSCNFYILAVGTPIDPATQKPRLNYVESATASLVPVLKRGDTVVLRSTVPMGTSRNVVLRTLERETGLVAGRDFSFGFVPERTVEGNAVWEQRNLPQILGALDAASQERIVRVFGSYNRNLVCVPDMEHAELCKIIDNTYRDMVFAYSNQMAMICESLGLDFHQIRTACNQDYPRNNVAAASPGVGGACLTKDPYILIDLCNKLQIDTQLIRAARNVNEKTVFRLAQKILQRLSSLGRSPYSSKIFLMGFAFKGEPPTSDTRFSTTYDLLGYLRPFCSRIHGYDAEVDAKELDRHGVVPSTIAEGFRDADAVVIMTSHRSHRDLPIAELAETANNHLLFVDCWNLYRHASLGTAGRVIYTTVGRY